MFKKFLVVGEIAWIIIAAVSLVEFILLFDEPGDERWLFAGFFILAVIMFLWRRRSRLRLEAREKLNQETEESRKL
jgi:uncharacterized membrane protein